MGDRLRVLVVQAFGERNGGAELWLLRLLDATQALHVEVVLLKDGPMRQELEARGIPVEVLSVGRHPWSLLLPASVLMRRVRRTQPDVLLGSTVKGQLLAAPVGRLLRTPTVWAKHDHSYDRTMARLLGRLSAAVIAGAEEVAEPVRRRDVVIIPPPRPAGAPATREEAVDHLSRLGLPVGSEQPILLMAGRVVPFKGIDDAVRALALPAAEGWRLVVAGTDDHSSPGETDRLRRLAVDCGVGDRVHLVGHVDRVAHWMAGFDALAVLTRRTRRREPAREGFGGTAFEAMLAGIPVVAVEGGAVVRRLQGRAGIGVPPGCPDAVAEALGRLRSRTARIAAGEAGRALVADHPDAAACAALLVQVLERAAGRPIQAAP